jgi:hypothetical protein
MLQERKNQEILIQKSLHLLSSNGMPLSYHSIKDKIQPFDLIAFRGGDVISDLISELESRQIGVGTWTHVGMIVTADILPYYIVDNKQVPLQPNHLYIFESTFSYQIAGVVDGTPDVVTGSSKFGVQLRDFEVVLNRYITGEKTKAAWCQLINNPFMSYSFDKQNSERVSRNSSVIMKDVCMKWILRVY